MVQKQQSLMKMEHQETLHLTTVSGHMTASETEQMVIQSQKALNIMINNMFSML